METLARFVIALIVLAAIWYAVGGQYEKKRRKRPPAPAPDERNWQRAFMRDCKRGYPRN